MKKSTKTALGFAAAGAGVFFLAKSAGAFGGNAESPGSLGGNESYDDSLTAEGNPFARIDPNYQYPSPAGAQDRVINPDGTSSIVVTDPDGVTYETSPSGIIDYPQDAPLPGMTVQQSSWFENPFVQGAALAAGAIALEEGWRAAKNRAMKKTPTSELVEKAQAKTSGAKKSPMQQVREKMGFNSNKPLPEQEIVRARSTTPEDFTPSKLKEKAPVKVANDPVAGKARAEVEVGKAQTKGKSNVVGKVGEVGSLALIYTQIAGDVVQGQRQLTAALPDATRTERAQQGAYDVVRFGERLVDAPIALIYRPGSKSDFGQTGWFGGVRDVVRRGQELRQQDLADDGKLSMAGFLRSIDILGLESTYSAFRGGSVRDGGMSALSTGSTVNQSVPQTSFKVQDAVVAPHPNVATQAPVTANRAASSGSVGNKVLHTGETAIATQAKVNQMAASGMNNAQIINSVVAQSSASKSSSSSSSSSKVTAQQSKSSGTIVGKSSSGKIVVKSNKSKIIKK